MKELIQTEGLVYEYRPDAENGTPVRALDGLDLRIAEGSFIAVLGMNGSGKSTLAKCLNALYIPTEGAVWIDGMNTADEERVWDLRSTAGMVFQNPDNQIVSSIVEDDVAFGPENLGVPSDEIRKRIDEAMKAVGIYEQRNRQVHLLSGGQKQRVSIAGVLAMQPRCIIFDESTAMLDPRGRRDMVETILELNRRGITAILITHYMEEAARADRIFIMNEGKLVFDGTPAEAFSETERLLKWGLDLPPAVRIRNTLRAEGLAIPDHILELEELADWLAAAGEEDAN